MHNLKFKKSIASNTIKNSLSKTSLPRHSFVLFLKMGWGKGGGGGSLLRYVRWISSFTKLDKNKSYNNNNKDNNLKSNCLCSILLIDINRRILTPRVQVYTFITEECTGATTEKGATSVVCLVPNFTFCAHKFLYMGWGPVKAPSRPHTPAAHIQSITGQQWLFRLCGPAHSLTHLGSNDRGANEVQTEEEDPEVQKLSIPFPGCKTFITHYIATLILSV